MPVEGRPLGQARSSLLSLPCRRVGRQDGGRLTPTAVTLLREAPRVLPVGSQGSGAGTAGFPAANGMWQLLSVLSVETSFLTQGLTFF